VYSALSYSTGSFYALSSARLNSQVMTWKSHLPKVKPYYAVKCNPEPKLIEWLSNSDVGFDCASAREIEIVKNTLKTADIIFANPCKKREDILYAKELNIETTVVDSKEEVEKLAVCGWKGDSLIRIIVNDSGSKMPFSSKFGTPLTQATEIYEFAKEKGQKISGISFHVGSGCETPSQYSDAILDASKLLLKWNKTGIIDIGGGFENDSFAAAAKEIVSARGYIPSNTTLIAEPGRFFASNCQDLFVKVIGKKPIHNKFGFRYTLDESLYGQFSCIPFDQAKPKWIRVQMDDSVRRKVPTVLYGRTCDSLDMIAKADEAEELMEGDWLWFPNMGAYTTVTSTEFNGFPKPPIIIEDSLPHPSEFSWPIAQYISPMKGI